MTLGWDGCFGGWKVVVGLKGCFGVVGGLHRGLEGWGWGLEECVGVWRVVVGLELKLTSITKS